jgi:Asp-tRNA(Asn)/Glu-tRNA(Gln) amidotransferase A subunit family amidase
VGDEVRYSNSNQVIRHVDIPTVSVLMGIMEDIKMPINLTLAEKAYEDSKLSEYAYAFEQGQSTVCYPHLFLD